MSSKMEEKVVARKRRLSKRERKSLKKSKFQQVPSRKDGEDSKNMSTSKNSTHHDNSVFTEEEDTLNSYVPVSIPTVPFSTIFDGDHNSKENVERDFDEGGCKSLGKWFPKAIVIKCSIYYTNTGIPMSSDHTSISHSATQNPKASLLLFYQYTTGVHPQPWSHHQLKLFMSYLVHVAKARNLGGRLRVSTEGINATVTSVNTTKSSAALTLRHFAEDLKTFDSVLFGNTHFKYIDNLSPDRHFKECKILPVQELVFYGIREEDAPVKESNDRKKGGGIHLEPEEYHEMLRHEGAVVIDVRNHYETVIGRLDGQTKLESGGAQYIDPLMRKSTDFTSWLSKDETKQQLEGKTVLMYCTGGIRCERASAYLKGQMGDAVKGVYQLKGGIENYMKIFPDGGFWRGKNFVFDKREVVGVENPDGDGGVLRKEERKKIKNRRDNYENNDVQSNCCRCGESWYRYVGKRKCCCCGVPVLMCDTCMSKKPDKTIGLELSVRCPLCVTENVTLPAKHLVFTDNGMKAKLSSDSEADLSRGQTSQMSNLKAASSVLKWGGGYALTKKNLASETRKLCRFGLQCRRSDCFFAHPEAK